MSPLNGLLFAWCEGGDKVSEEEIRHWYDDEHIPARFVVPGWYNGARLKAVDSQKPTFVVYCDLESVDTVNRPEYIGLYDKVSQLEQDIVKKLEVLHRRMYTTVADTHDPRQPYPSFPGKYVAITMLNLSSEGMERLNGWYDETLLSAMKQLRGWSRSRMYELVSNDDWASTWGKDHTFPHMIVHESTRNNVPDLGTLLPPLPGVIDVLERRFEVATVFEQPDGHPQPK